MICTYIFKICDGNAEKFSNFKQRYKYVKFTPGRINNDSWKAQFCDNEHDSLTTGQTVFADLKGGVLIAGSQISGKLDMITSLHFINPIEQIASDIVDTEDYFSDADEPYYSKIDGPIFLSAKRFHGYKDLHNSSFVCKSTHIRFLYQDDKNHNNFTPKAGKNFTPYVIITVGYTVVPEIEYAGSASSNEQHQEIATRTLGSYNVSQTRWKPLIHLLKHEMFEPEPDHPFFARNPKSHAPEYLKEVFEEYDTCTEIICNNFLYCGQANFFTYNLQSFLPVDHLPWFFQMPSGTIEYLGDRAVAGEKPVLSVASYSIYPDSGVAKSCVEVINSWVAEYQQQV